MEQDLLTELKLPNLEHKNLESIVRQNAVRLKYLIQAQNIYLKKLSVNEEHKVSMSPYSGFSYEIFSATENITLKSSLEKISVKEKNGSLTNHNELKFSQETKLKVYDKPRSTCTSLVSNLGWDSNDENESESVQARSYPTRFLCESDTPFSWEPDFIVDASIEAESNICCESEYLLDTKTVVEEEEKTQVLTVSENSISERQNYDFPPMHSNNKSVRCYHRKKMGGKLNSSEPNMSLDKNFKKTEMKNNIQESENSICCISEIMGNANAAFSGSDTDLFNLPLITPKKTNDITKIKGWRRKQFYVEKPATGEYCNLTDEKFIEVKEEDATPKTSVKSEIPEASNNENAFVCDSLDEFLETDAALKINYEIPHLYAEVGIKLTSEEIVSKPNLSLEHFKEVESKYCIPVQDNSIKVENDDDIKSGKIMLDTELASLKKLRAVDVKRQLVKSLEKQVNKEKLRNKSSLLKNKLNGDHLNKKKVHAIEEIYKNFKNVNLASKLVGLIVISGPGNPLHPLVRLHLSKIRSYRTKIDKNWASFAASAVLTKNEKPHKTILPVFCIGKLNTNPTKPPDSNEQPKAICNTVLEEPSPQPKRKKNENSCNMICDKTSTLPENLNEPGVKLKKCSVVIDKMKAIDSFRVWCMEHNRYYCGCCRWNRNKPNSINVTKALKVDKKSPIGSKIIGSKEIKKTVYKSKTTIDKTIASLLSKKLKAMKSKGDTDTSIDCLKAITPNAVELIKLNFIKQSFQTGYVNIWYLKSENDLDRSRAFLTFSNVPPFHNAIDLKSNKFSWRSLPQVITEIVSGEDLFDSNEYAILHCNGDVWEIHGCLNLGSEKNERALKKDVKNVEQIFTPHTLPEVPHLQRLAHKLLLIKLSKWWVLDLSQKFHELIIKSCPVDIPVTRKKLVGFIKSGMFGYVTLNKDDEGRILGAYIFAASVPFVLIGPYYISENHDLTLKLDSDNIPFLYHGEKNTSRDCSLKSFINSVITEFQESDKRVEGLWLYDKTFNEDTCYLEVVTTENPDAPKRNHNIHVEHGYSLTTPPTSDSSVSVSAATNGGKAVQETVKKIVIYLYFEINDLGYLQGELQSDNSVIINHPLNNQTKVKSFSVADWFLSFIKRRIRFIPKNLQVRWFITRHKRDLGERQPFNKFYLGGAHILCKKGLFFLLQLTEPKIEELGLDKKEVRIAIARSKVINEVKELKALAYTLCQNSSTENLSMERVLEMAKEEIKVQEKLKETLLKRKRGILENQIINCWRYLRAVHAFQGDDKAKIELVDKIKQVFVNKEGELNPDFVKCLISFDFGRKYLLDRSVNTKNKKSVEEDDVIIEYEKPGLFKSESKSTKTFLPKGDSLIEELETKLSYIYSMLEVNATSQNSLKHDRLIKKLKAISEQLDFIKGIFGKSPEKLNEVWVKKLKPRDQNWENKKQIILSETDNSGSLGKSSKKEFIKLDPSESLPTNVQISTESLVATNSPQILTINEVPQSVETIPFFIKKTLNERTESAPVTTFSSNISDFKNQKIVYHVKKNNISPLKKTLIVKNLKNNKIAIQTIDPSFLPQNNETSTGDNEVIRNKFSKRKFDLINEDEIEIVAEIPACKKNRFHNSDNTFEKTGPTLGE